MYIFTLLIIEYHPNKRKHNKTHATFYFSFTKLYFNFFYNLYYDFLCYMVGCMLNDIKGESFLLNNVT